MITNKVNQWNSLLFIVRFKLNQDDLKVFSINNLSGKIRILLFFTDIIY